MAELKVQRAKPSVRLHNQKRNQWAITELDETSNKTSKTTGPANTTPRTGPISIKYCRYQDWGTPLAVSRREELCSHP